MCFYSSILIYRHIPGNFKPEGIQGSEYVFRIHVGQWFCGFSHCKVIGTFVYIIWIHHSNSCQITVDTDIQLTYNLGYAMHDRILPGWFNCHRKCQWGSSAWLLYIALGKYMIYNWLALHLATFHCIFLCETVIVQDFTCDHFGLNKMFDNN